MRTYESQNGSVGRRFGNETLQVTDGRAELPGILMPERVELEGHA